MLALTDQEKKVALFMCLVLGIGSALGASFKLSPAWGQGLSIISNDAFYPRVNVNKASVDELVAVPHIGPVTARRIVEARMTGGPFRSPAELSRAGIGEGISRRVGKYLTFR